LVKVAQKMNGCAQAGAACRPCRGGIGEMIAAVVRLTGMSSAQPFIT
jgi:hypothetical protein